MSAILAVHEEGKEHLENIQKWQELSLRMKKKTIDEENVRLIKQEEKYWQQILERLIALVRVLGMQNLPFCGTHEKLHTFGNGNFLKFFEYLALFDSLMNEHLCKITDEKTHIHYLGKDIRNELIQLLATTIKEEILASVQAAKYFSVILDCTPDVSHVEQLTMIVRYVTTMSVLDSDHCDAVCIKEHFLGFVPLKETTGASMTDTILHQLQEMSLPIENLRGQGYDNGSNMKGKENGVQHRILDVNPRALYVPCSAHSLNLVVNDAAKCCLEATAFFDMVQRTYVYFSGSTHRWEVLKRHVKNLTLKPLSDTRWESRIHALNPLRYQLGDVYDALVEISNDTTQTGSSGNISRIDAQGLAKGISSFKFVVSLVVWHNILFEINVTSKQLQTKTLDVRDAIKQLEESKKFLSGCRSDEGFEKVLIDAHKLAEELEIPACFEPDNSVRVRRKKKQFTYEADDEPIENPKENFKVNFFFAIIDTALQSVEERFTQMRQISSVFGFLYNIHSLKTEAAHQIFVHCLKLEKALQHGDLKDIDASDLCNELQVIARRVQNKSSPQDVLTFVYNNNLAKSMPNTCIALQILLTLPVSVASHERSFSKLKLIKSYIRSSMMQERLVGLATLSIEHDIGQHIDIKNLVSTFAKMKARKVNF
ncbi:zinc finger MYM-type protein 1-like [Ambystoma mexicanum]|uniref:zinc finger MYM-type protein 1-like n=1 Tax=Ambystoma mexicanum TaxID=8296 RepID=UPI0037E7D58A